MKRHELASLGLAMALSVSAPQLQSAQNQILGWNNLGMHCMDSDYSVFSILPPYNTIEAQLIVNGQLVTASNGYTLTYEAVADPSGSFNSTSIGKGNFSQYDQALYGANLLPDVGLLGWAMPGTNNVPQPMAFEKLNQPVPGVFTPVNWFHAEGIPITPYDNAGNKNAYPLMRVIARSGTTPIATNDIVLPVSDEMDCRACHASGTGASARPAAGWVWSADPERDYRLNILLLHDEQRDPDTYPALLASAGFNSQGLFRSVVADGKPVLCAKCHLSEALPGTGAPGVPPLTEAVHAFHAHVMDPVLNLTLDDSDNRAACYRCHPGSTTQCLRGAMGAAIAPDSSLEMQCQSCHGNMSHVGSDTRVGWIMEPNCQSCHSGTATSNEGQIRYSSVFTDTNGTVRVPVNHTFATQPDTPAAGLSLYRFSAGHGGLQCSACHGSTHAIFPSIHANDNLRNLAIQGHAGTTVECTACHTSVPQTFTGGPHGMHPVGDTDFAVKRDHNEQWFHGNATEDGGPGLASCRSCHGQDLRGTVLSRTHADRTIDTEEYGVKHFWRGYQVGCYDCHNGPGSEAPTPNHPPVVASVITNTLSGAPVSFMLQAIDADANPMIFRIVSQTIRGTVGLSNNIATYYPEPGFVGTEQFTFAARDGFADSNLGTGTVAIAQGQCSITADAMVPEVWPAGWPVPFGAMAAPQNIIAPVSFDWDFGDGHPHGTNQHTTHTFSEAGTYEWRLISSVEGEGISATVTNTGLITITTPWKVGVRPVGESWEIAWPAGVAEAVLEESPGIGSAAEWIVSTNVVRTVSGNAVVIISNDVPAKFFRLRGP